GDACRHRGAVGRDREQDPARPDHQAAGVIARRRPSLVARGRARVVRAGAALVIRLATRGSALALAQAQVVADRLEAGGMRVEIIAMRTEGDRRAEARLAAIGGNVDTRLAKLQTGEWDAVLLAAAGLRRLGLEPRHATPLAPEVFVPAVGQGVLGVQARADDAATLAALRPLDHAATRACALAERAFLARLGASCVTPMAAHARLTDGRLVVHGLVASEDGREVLRERGEGA